MGSIFYVDDKYGDSFVENKGLDLLESVLKETSGLENLRMLLWSLSNIAGGSECQVNAVMEHSILQEVIRIAETPGAAIIRREAFFVLIMIATSTRNEDKVFELLINNNQKVFKLLVESPIICSDILEYLCKYNIFVTKICEFEMTKEFE